MNTELLEYILLRVPKTFFISRMNAIDISSILFYRNNEIRNKFFNGSERDYNIAISAIKNNFCTEKEVAEIKELRVKQSQVKRIIKLRKFECRDATELISQYNSLIDLELQKIVGIEKLISIYKILNRKINEKKNS